MTDDSHPRIYEQIGVGYADYRKPDPRIEAQIRRAIGDVELVCNVGAGAGSYEPQDVPVIAVEPSRVMSSQRRNRAKCILAATAEQLPLRDDAVDASMAVLTIHHWLHPEQGLAEMRRIARRQVIFAFDPPLLDSFWLVQDYLPEILDLEAKRSLSIAAIAQLLHTDSIETVNVPHDCSDGFLTAYWRRPEMYLEPSVRRSISPFMQLPEQVVNDALDQLRRDLSTGLWHRKHAGLLSTTSCDFGYRLVVANR